VSRLETLEWLDLSNNRLVNIDSLQFATNLRYLNLADNELLDLMGLVINPGLGVGDTLDLRGNSLSTNVERDQIPMLLDKGLILYWTPRQ